MASVSVPVHPPSLATSTAVIAKRSLLKFRRTPQRIGLDVLPENDDFVT
jgi:hypothetical protein